MLHHFLVILSSFSLSSWSTTTTCRLDETSIPSAHLDLLWPNNLNVIWIVQQFETGATFTSVMSRDEICVGVFPTIKPSSKWKHVPIFRTTHKYMMNRYDKKKKLIKNRILYLYWSTSSWISPLFSLWIFRVPKFHPIQSVPDQSIIKSIHHFDIEKVHPPDTWYTWNMSKKLYLSHPLA